jgi:hypothetical protein
MYVDVLVDVSPWAHAVHPLENTVTSAVTVIRVVLQVTTADGSDGIRTVRAPWICADRRALVCVGAHRPIAGKALLALAREGSGDVDAPSVRGTVIVSGAALVEILASCVAAAEVARTACADERSIGVRAVRILCARVNAEITLVRVLTHEAISNVTCIAGAGIRSRAVGTKCIRVAAVGPKLALIDVGAIEAVSVPASRANTFE